MGTSISGRSARKSVVQVRMQATAAMAEAVTARFQLACQAWSLTSVPVSLPAGALGQRGANTHSGAHSALLIALVIPGRLAPGHQERLAKRPWPPGWEAAIQAVTWAREVKPSLVGMCSTWFSAVRCETTSPAAISLLLRSPAVTYRSDGGDGAAALRGAHRARRRPFG